MQWSAGGQTSFCRTCLEEDIKNNVPLTKRKEHRLPCPTHGDPRLLYTANQPWVDLYGLIANYHEWRQQKDREPEPFLNLSILQVLCHEAGIDFFQGLHKMQIIHKAIYG